MELILMVNLVLVYETVLPLQGLRLGSRFGRLSLLLTF